MSQLELIPFGKYKGQPVEVLQQDRQYYEWLVAQSWFNERYPQLKTIIINNFKEPSETPEHNKLQGMFLDYSFCERVIKHFEPRFIDGKTTLYLKNVEVSNVIFENEGIDVSVSTMCYFESECGRKEKEYFLFCVELKPVLSDDYPAVLRQMKSAGGHYLICNTYTGIGVTREQVHKIFSSSNIRILFLDDIDLTK